MKPGKPRELPWSWERSPGWNGQVDRMRRWRQRLIAMQGTPDVQVTFDIVLTFFINCYHVRDWLERSGALEKSTIDQLFRDSASLRACADIANIAKHFDLTSSPRLTYQLSFAREYVGVGHGWFGKDARLVILSDGKTIDVLELVEKCELEWLHFFTQNG